MRRRTRLQLVLHCCEIRSLTLRQHTNFKYLKKKTVRKVFGPEKCGRILHNKELSELYRSPHGVRIMKNRSYDGLDM
jgi:hypothetical protein